MKIRLLWLLGASILLWLQSPGGETGGEALAADRRVDLEIILAVDVSASVDRIEAALQRGGYVTALRHPAVLRAIRAGPAGAIAATYVEWAGWSFQRTVVDWRVIEDAPSARAFVDLLTERPIASVPYTSISGLIDFARRRFRDNGYDGLRRVIDISGDGPNSDGRMVKAARDDAVAAGITINGLPILSTRPSLDGVSPAIGVASYYVRNVIGGPGAFALEVLEYDTFTPTLVEKLVREIRGELQLSERSADAEGPVSARSAAPARAWPRLPGGP